MKGLTTGIFLLLFLPLFAGSGLPELYNKAKELLNNKQYHESMTISEELLAQSLEAGSTEFTVKSYYILAYLSDKVGDRSNAVIYYLEAARYAESDKDPYIREILASIYYNVAEVLGDLDLKELAHRFNDKGAIVAKEVDDMKTYIDIQLNDALEYNEEQKYQQSMPIYQALLKLPDLTHYQHDRLNNGIAYSYELAGDLMRARQYYQKIIDNPTNKPSEYYGFALNNIGNLEFNTGNYEESILWYEKGLSAHLEADFDPGALISYLNLGEAYNKANKLSLSASSYLKAIEVAEQEHLETEHIELYKTIAEIYQQLDKPLLSEQYHEKYIAYLESNLQSQRELEMAERKYNMELLTSQYFDMVEAQESRKFTIFIAITSTTVISLAFISFIFSIYYKRYKLKLSLEKELRAIEMNSDV